MENPAKVRKDLEEVEIDVTMEVIKKMSIENLKAKVNASIRKAALMYLKGDKFRMSKIMHISHEL